ncbi:MAG: ligase-associated DNA damage response endonuclease PdeM [Planctomycetota bacterium]
MSDRVEVCLGGVTLELLPGRGVYWRDQETLLVADTHLGKEASFRHQTMPVPSGTTTGTLAQVQTLLDQTGARRLVILGDMFHDEHSLAEDVVASIDEFFRSNPTVRFLLTKGNHDERLKSLPIDWPLEVVTEYRIADVALTHQPGEAKFAADLVLCGHIHPAYRIGSATDKLGKLPCYWFSAKHLVLPAIGEFTGTHRIRKRKGDRVWLIADGQVVEG